MVERLLIALWSVMVSFFIVYALGFTNILSSLVSPSYIGYVVDVIFVVIAVVFAFLFWKLIPRSLSLKVKTAAFLPPFLFIFCLFIMR